MSFTHLSWSRKEGFNSFNNQIFKMVDEAKRESALCTTMTIKGTVSFDQSQAII
jgi:hypothetical protein